ncbi:MAG: hypothetical protein OXC46_03765 [Thaumarchaeota archaeon]|nr:hypothetical protein [Nitrososphaerota archaeon]
MGYKVELEIKKILQDGNDLHKFIILMTNANDESIKGRLKLQKIMYLISNSIVRIKELCSYESGNYGPYSKILDEEARYLEQIGVLTEDVGKITLTGIGKKIAQELHKNEDEKTLYILNKHKDFLNDMTKNELLTYIYSAHPDMTKKSDEYENLKPHMEKHVMSLLKKHKISAQRAGELLKIPQYTIIKKMNAMNMITLR